MIWYSQLPNRRPLARIRALLVSFSLRVVQNKKPAWKWLDIPVRLIILSEFNHGVNEYNCLFDIHWHD